MAKLIPMVLDFETFFSQEHSLTKMNPLSYIMHPDTEIISCSAKTNGHETFVAFGEDNIRQQMQAWDWSDKIVIAHNNAGFDAAILKWRFNINPAMFADTLAMARPIHAKTTGMSLAKLVEHYGLGKKDQTALMNTKGRHLKDFTPGEIKAMGKYNKDDVDQCWGLFQKLLPLTSKREMKLIDMTIRMLTEPGFELDIPLLEKTLVEERARKKETLVNLARMTGAYEPGMTDEEAANAVCTTLGSAAKFGKLLTDLGVEVPTKISPTTKKVAPALAKTDEAFVALTKSSDPIVAAAANARLGVKSTLLESRISTFLEVGRACNGKKPIALNYYGADTTGRDSGGMSMNDQNLPRISPGKPKPTDALRMSLRAPKGMKVVVADLSGIELRTNMFLWQVPYAMKLFQDSPDKADLYRYFAANDLYGIAEDEVTKDQRQIGKVCVAEGTLVLCLHESKSFWCAIENFKPEYQLWDGKEWVWAKGVVSNGWKKTQQLCGVSLTPDHLVLCGTTWQEAQFVHGEQVARALATGAENLSSLDMLRAIGTASLGLSFSAIVGFLSTCWRRKTSKLSSQLAAIVAHLSRAPTPVSCIGGTHPLCQTMSTGNAFSTDYLQRSVDATHQRPSSFTTMAVGESKCVNSGEPTEKSFSHMYLRLMGGITRSLKWIASTLTETTNRETFGSLVAKKTCETSAKFLSLNDELPTLKHVFDILNCGPRNRFTILSNRGPLIVHNCHLGLGFGAGGPTFQRIAKMMGGIDMSLDDSTATVGIYRGAHQEIAGPKGGWKSCGTAIKMISEGLSYQIDPWGMCWTTAEGIKTPQGMIRYPDLRQEEVIRNEGTQFEKTEMAWVYGRGRHRAFLSGPKVTENIVQHLAREVVMDNALEIKRVTGYGTKHRIHDELVFVVPDSEAEDMLDTVQGIMRTPPKWWPELITWSEGSYADTYGEAK